MRYFEVFVADGRYRRNTPLTYSYSERLAAGQVVTVPLRNRVASAFVLGEVDLPQFATKPIKSILSSHLLPEHCLELANWLKDYYHCSLGEVLRQFAPSQPAIRSINIDDNQFIDDNQEIVLRLEQPLTKEQKKAIAAIKKTPTNTVLLHGETGSGKTRVYLELAKETLKRSRSVVMLTPEIALTSQLSQAFASQLEHPVYVLHSQLAPAKRKKIWLAILESPGPVVIIGPRSALFSPVREPGLIILDEAHEPAYKQDQAPRYHTARVASQLAAISGAKVVLGTATPSITDYYLAQQHNAIVRMKEAAVKSKFGAPDSQLIDIKDRDNFKKDAHLSDQLIEAMNSALATKKQVMIYLNRRGSARLILCNACGWQLLCPNCDVPLIYHGDEHITRCHICGYKQKPPISCPVCSNTGIIYRSIGTKTLIESVKKHFPQQRVVRFDSDSTSGERIHELYNQLKKGEVDILVGTQVLAKGFDLPKLALVGVVAAETSMALPDFASEERSFQLLYQVVGRVGRGHGHGNLIIQTYNPNNIVIQSALSRDYQKFYDNTLKERQEFRFPPYAYLLKLVCRRATKSGGETAANALAKTLSKQSAAKRMSVEVVGPTPSFYARRGRYFYWQIVLKSKQREHLLALAASVPANWTVDLDPTDLL